MKKFLGKNKIEYVLSGSCAIISVLKSNLKSGSKVLIPNNVCARVLESIILCDLIPVIVRPKNGLIIQNCDVDAVKKEVNFDAIFLVHNYGMECDVKTIRDNNKTIMIIEDCAQYWGKCDIVGKYSDFVITSVDVNKPLYGNHIGIIAYDDKCVNLDMGISTRYCKELHIPFYSTIQLSNNELIKIIKLADKHNNIYNKYISILNKVLNNYDNIIFPNKECNNLKYPIIFKKDKDYKKFIDIADKMNFTYSEPHEKNLENLPVLSSYKCYFIDNGFKYNDNQIFIKINLLTKKYIKKLDYILKEVYYDKN